MRVLAIVHQRDAGPGVFAEEIRARGHHLDEWAISESFEAPGDPLDYDAVMTFGGAMHADEDAEHAWLRPEKELLAELLHRGRPLLGSCLGSQLLAEAAGARARRASEPEIGWFEVEITEEGAADPVIGPLAPTFTAFEWHSYESPLPPGAVALARSPVCLQAYRVDERAWGIQFHAEVGALDLEAWIDGYDTDPDAVRLGIDPEQLHAETRPRVDAWNKLGRELCGRFIEAAERV
jgi:GMP synthase (glutamine-hydrolysing)